VSYYDDDDFAAEYRRRDEEALDDALTERETQLGLEVARRERARNCATCNGQVLNSSGRWVARRETKGMVCQSCGWDYGQHGEP